MPKRIFILTVVIVFMLLACKASDTGNLVNSRFLCSLFGGTWTRSNISEGVDGGYCKHESEIQVESQDRPDTLDEFSSDEASAPDLPVQPQVPSNPIITTGEPENLTEGETPPLDNIPAGTISDRVGTYTSTTDFCAPFIEDWFLSVVKDELSITINEQGLVSGSMDVLCEGTLSEPISWGDDNSRNCSVQINMSAVGTLSGKLDESGETGVFDLEVMETKEIIRIDCPAGTEKTPYQGTLSVSFEFFGDTLVGVVPDFISFEATRQ